AVRAYVGAVERPRVQVVGERQGDSGYAVVALDAYVVRTGHDCGAHRGDGDVIGPRPAEGQGQRGGGRGGACRRGSIGGGRRGARDGRGGSRAGTQVGVVFDEQPAA